MTTLSDLQSRYDLACVRLRNARFALEMMPDSPRMDKARADAITEYEAARNALWEAQGQMQEIDRCRLGERAEV